MSLPNHYKLFYISGYAYDSDCIYVNGTGEDEYEFYIQLNRCGTLGGSDHNKKRNVHTKNRDPTVNCCFQISMVSNISQTCNTI